MAKKSIQLVIKQHEPVRYWLMMTFYALIFGAVGWAMYTLGHKSAGTNNAELSNTVEKLKDYARSLEEQKAKLLEQVAVVERNRQVEQQAFSDVDSSLKGQQEEILELKQEVAFYRGIVAPRGDAEGGLNIQSFRIEKSPEAHTYRFKLVLTQLAKMDVAVRGRVRIDIAGVKDGKPTSLSLAEVSSGAAPSLELKFKYFQTVEGSMMLPSGFAPTNVAVEIAPAGGKLAGFSKNFAWETLLN